MLFSKRFDELNTKELYEILKSRGEIFVVEQNCIYQDMDDKDYHSVHVCQWKNERVTAYLRVFMKDEITGIAQIGRVLSLVHGQGDGKIIMKEGIRICREVFRAKKVFLEAQCYAIGFYEKYGFNVRSEEFIEDGIPHVCMELELN